MYSEKLFCFSFSETGLAAIVNKLKDKRFIKDFLLINLLTPP
ncbi:hypothetical protein LEP1GSC021_3762 [Leptospira noguchii str. 1993005606]|uniref:Uncharacterized protein n=1 Tax=Leptospira noguchii str. 2007001578 TaxID=1049974 RepID=A0ABN0J6X6_9LEPT|nr:hypothetical protein LEP1GSC072_3995 [Leptospira noguchii str. Bonito]EMN02757.1 hypothetical protein LEP1GSC035_2181 [Leptospira noguchii str. 2007001578]EPE85395.1 hypothetical protein LEP1GSC021_3762 [Leptospira noguchii str. 1993005606]